MPQPTRRTWLMAAVIAVPALAAAVGLSAFEGYRLVQPVSPLFGSPRPATLAEAITHGFGVEHAYAFIHGGQDPNQPITVNDSNYTEGRAISASPLMLAVAARDSSGVRMLFNFGARLELPQNRLAVCLAREIEDQEILEIIASNGGAELSLTCPERRPDAPTPLLAWAN